MEVGLQDLSRRLFATANQLWANTAQRPDQHGHPVLALIALRQMEAKFGAVDAELAKLFEKAPRTAAETLKEGAEKRAKEMAEANPSRKHLVEKLEELVARYNAGGMEAEAFFEALKAFVEELDDEERRAVREELTEAELAIFDLLTKPEPKLTMAQEIQVKAVARKLLERLEMLLQAINWTANQQTRGAVLSAIRQQLNALPEAPYPRGVWSSKVDDVWQFVLRRHGGGPPSVP